MMPWPSLDGIEPFDSTPIPAYDRDHEAVYEYIDEHLDAHVAQLQRWMRQTSISATGTGIAEMAGLLVDDLRRLGCQEVELVPTDGHPGVWAYFDAGAPKTLMIYLMYDVQPADPADWLSPPFDAELIDHELGSVLLARGAVDQKGPERALLNAMESIVAVHGTLPVNVMITAEGEEELGSPHYRQIVGRYEQRLRTCDGALLPFLSQDARGAASLSLGVKGLLYLELEARGGPWGGPQRTEVAGPLKVLVDSPAWRLVGALASMTSPDGNTITVPGYGASIREPSPEELALAAGMLPGWDPLEAGLKEQYGIARWQAGLGGPDSLMQYLFGTALNINGISSGYTGSGMKTVLPATATAKVDVRLVPDQQPDEVVETFRRHLDGSGFADVDMRVVASYPPAQTSVSATLVRRLVSVLHKYGTPPALAVRSAGSAPWYQFTEHLGLPVACGGLGHGSGAHAPNEYMVIRPNPGSDIAGLAEIEKAYVDLLYAFAEPER